MKNKNYYVPLMLIFCLFFLWGYQQQSATYYDKTADENL